jgi:UPF0755 protein
MQSLKRFAEKILDKVHLSLHALSKRWDRHANRRTIIVLSLIGSMFLFSYAFFVRSPSAFPEGELIEIPEGASLSEIATLLKEERVIRSAFLLQLAVFVQGYEREIQFGDYVFDKPHSVFSVARALGIGTHGLDPIRVRVHEGATVEGIATLFAARFERFDTERFLLEASELEGYLYPDTYFFLPNADDELILRTLKQNFGTRLVAISSQIAVFGESLEDVVTMASILEREAQNLEDRRTIAGVLWKRLEIGMPLQVDAAFLYTLGKATFELTGKDLESDDPYNTYVYKGLPPGPIGSPTLESILAAVTPIKSDYLYYLADKDLVTHYSETYEEHLEKKREYLGG